MTSRAHATMATDKSERLLARLEESKRRFGPGEAARAEKAIAAAGKGRFRDAQSLIRFHDALLFLRAFPQGPGVVRLTETLLAGMHARVEQLRASGADMSAFDDESVSGIAGIEIVDTFPYEIATLAGAVVSQARRNLLGRRHQQRTPGQHLAALHAAAR